MSWDIFGDESSVFDFLQEQLFDAPEDSAALDESTEYQSIDEMKADIKAHYASKRAAELNSNKAGHSRLTRKGYDPKVGNTQMDYNWYKMNADYHNSKGSGLNDITPSSTERDAKREALKHTNHRIAVGADKNSNDRKREQKAAKEAVLDFYRENNIEITDEEKAIVREFFNEYFSDVQGNNNKEEFVMDENLFYDSTTESADTVNEAYEDKLRKAVAIGEFYLGIFEDIMNEGSDLDKVMAKRAYERRANEIVQDADRKAAKKKAERKHEYNAWKRGKNDEEFNARSKASDEKLKKAGKEFDDFEKHAKDVHHKFNSQKSVKEDVDFDTMWSLGLI